MAEVKNETIDILKNEKIEVVVNDAHSDLLVVSFEYGTQRFQGILLDSTKG